MRTIIIIFITAFGSTMLGEVFDINKIKYFINTYGVTKLPEREYLSYIRQGKNIVSSIINKKCDQLVLRERKLYLSEIIACMWYLYGLAINKNQGFVDGVIVLDDANQLFYNFLYDYVKNVNSKGLSKRAIITTNPYGYGRRSTHFPDDQRTFMQYGIDIRLNKIAQKILPGNKTHILFGRLANGLTFIKMEHYGLYYKDGFIGHACGYLRLILGKFLAKFVAQKERFLHRKEYVPCWIKKGYKNVSKRKCRLTSIKDIVENGFDDKVFINLIKKIENSYDHIPLRYGNEVILKNDEIKAHL